ncbi:Ig-like domain-containing protein [Rhodohalobacter sp. 8-1]|uniref:Ig-like domain-containing protein n=1 Tax=Rhodohalobacter sp. 8-1 TaxID=3131972 RepID=UPI0030EB35F6
MARELTHSVEILNEGYANLNIFGDSLSVEVIKEGVFYVDVNVKDKYGFDITKRISFTARYNKPWISAEMDTLRFDTPYVGRSEISTIELNHTLPVDRNYALAFENGDVFSADVSEVSLTENGTSEIEVTFSPNSEDIFSDTLYLIYSGFETDTSFALPITATGLTMPDPIASISTNSISFGDVKPGSDKTEYVTLTNTGVIDIQVDSVVTSNMAFGVDLQSTSLKPDSSLSIAATFSPDQIGEYNDSLRVYVKDMEAMVVSLDGRGAAAIAELGISAQNFGNVKVGETSEKSFWLYNKGNLALSLDALLLKGEVFSTRLSAEQIPAFDSLAVTTSFSPADVVSYSQNLQLIVDSGSDTLFVELNGSGFADPSASISTNSISFGDVKPGSNKAESVTLTNTGVIDIQVDSVVTSNMAFGVDLQSTSLKPDSSLSIAATFSPDQIGEYNDSLRVYVKDMEAMVVSLDGRGAAAIAGLEVTAQNFGNVKVGETSEKGFWLYNKGNLALSLDALLLEGEVFGSQLPAELIPAFDSLAVTSTFTPVEAVGYSKDLQLIVDSGSDTLSVALNGTGFTDPPPEPGVAFSTDSLSFGDTFLTDQKTDTLIIRNSGGVVLSIDSVKVSTAEFIYEFQPFVLKPDSSSNLLISFQPSQIGFYRDTLQVFINELGMSEIPLSGSGVGAVAELSERTHDFGEVIVGESSDVDIWLYNRGNLPLIIDALTLDSEVFSVEMLNSEVAAQDSVKLIARFSPLNAESYEDALILKTNASADTLLLTMTGLGTSAVSIDGDSQVPVHYSLEQNYPNPFNPSTTIKYSLPEAENVNLQVFDLLGRQVASLISKHQSAGVHTVNFDASQLATGIYIYRIAAGNFVMTKKLMLVK